ncbi:MAG: hypothetical protein AMXMBFR64_27780 [Myxococcales bacterium]
MTDFLPDDRDLVIPLEARGGLPKSVHLLEQEQARAVNAALATGRPLLVRGLPGTGKSQFARAAAEQLRRPFVATVVDGQTETRDLLWTVDAVARLARAQAIGAMRPQSLHEVSEEIAPEKFVQPGALWWAFDWTDAENQAERGGPGACLRVVDGFDTTRGCVVLVDEIDKADATVPNGLLEALGNGSFNKPFGGTVTMNRETPPLVVVTTNEERALPDAFLRRCLVLHLELPKGRGERVRYLALRGEQHFEGKWGPLVQEAAELVADDYAAARRAGKSPPGVAEYIDLVRAVGSQRKDEVGQRDLLKLVKQFALEKHPREERP